MRNNKKQTSTKLVKILVNNRITIHKTIHPYTTCESKFVNESPCLKQGLLYLGNKLYFLNYE